MSEETLDMRDEDRLPWLEAVEEDDTEGLGVGKLLLFVFGGLAVVAVIVGVAFWANSGGDEGASGELIAAPEGEYRVRPDEAGGMEVEGEGDAAFAASEGENPDARIDPSAVPEEPVAGRREAASEGEASRSGAAGATGSASARIPESGGQLADSAPSRSTDSGNAPSASSGRLIQLGAFSSEAAANRAWRSLSGRYDYLASLDQAVSTVEAGGRTLYRLRAAAGTAEEARRICGRLRVATEDCSVVTN